MTNEIKAEAAKKRGPKPKAKAKRQPMASGSKQLEPREGLDANYHYRWCAGYGKGKIERYKGSKIGRCKGGKVVNFFDSMVERLKGVKI
jgi:hypothetical protein